ncbi:MAG: spondin domain-containing protein [Planctomycetota bacterium]
MQSLEKRQLLAADVLEITVENLSDPGGLLQTPFWVAAHDGTFDLGDEGRPASDFGGLEEIAEDGVIGPLAARFAAENTGVDGVVTSPAGFPGAPVFDPGEIASIQLDLSDTLNQRYLSFASMVIPSNDAFVANLDPLAYPIFDDTGEFLGPQTIVLYGRDVYDAGTEVNAVDGGPAFVVGGGTSSDEGGVIALHPGLDDFVGADLPTGETLGKAFGNLTPIARVSVHRAAQPGNAIDNSGPKAAADVDVLDQRANFHEIQVTYADPSGIDITSIDTNDLRVTSPLLDNLEILSVNIDANAGTTPNEVVATYRVAPDSGSFTHLDNGTYTVVLLGGQVQDTLGQTAAAELLAEFDVDAPVRLQVEYENLAPLGGLSQTPVWIAAHDGTFEIARAGVAASEFPGLEDLAEEGDVSGLAQRFADFGGQAAGVLTAPGGFPGAPVIEPGESVIASLDIADPTLDRFFSYASMVIPSNDAFIANLNAQAFELFNTFGEFTGARTITIYGNRIWDSGTEVNDVNGGAAFSTEGGNSSDENGVIRDHDGLDDFIGSGLPTGEVLNFAFGSMTPIGRFTLSLADMPSDPIDDRGPLAQVDVADATVAGAATHDIRVTYSDGSGIDPFGIDANDIEVLSSTGQRLVVDDVNIEPSSNGVSNELSVLYSVRPEADRDFGPADNGLYFVRVLADAVTDTRDNGIAEQALGSFEVLTPVQIEVTVENLAIEGGLAQTPFWVAAHEGNFAVAELAGMASDFGGLEEIAEEGVIGPLATRFAAESAGTDGVVAAPDGFPGAPVFEPGETSSIILDVQNTSTQRYFSFASMVIPSNDAFLANLDPMAYELFDQDGFFSGPLTITLYGNDVLDAGTEVNDPFGGAAFSAEGGNSVDENGRIRRHEGLDDFIGTGLPTGEMLLSAFDHATPLARITVGLVGANSVADDTVGPNATLVADDITTAGTPEHFIEVTYQDPSGVDITSIDVDDLAINGPLNRPLEITDVEIVGDPGDTSVLARYTVTTPDGPFTARDNGTYVVTLIGGQVGDTLGQTAPTSSIGTLEVRTGIRVEVTVESLTEVGGLYQTPFWVGFHDGSFEVARRGVEAAGFGGLELIAETGDASELAARFAAETQGTGGLVVAPDGFPGAPVFDPGETQSIVLEIDGTDQNRFFSFASMVIPSNDAFVGNVRSTAHELFDEFGNFRGARQITLFGEDILDAGTEVNDPAGGAAFSTGGGVSVDEDGLIRQLFDLDEFIGTGLPTGENLASAFSADTPIAMITISLFDPEPNTCSGEIAACSSRSVSLQNSQLSADVNRDGRISALDSLLVLNFLRRSGVQSTISDEAQATGLDLDVSGNDMVTPQDALLVLNEIRRRQNSFGEAEFVGDDDSSADTGGFRLESTAIDQVMSEIDDKKRFAI